MLKDNLIALRKVTGMSQEELAEKVGVARQTLSKWEGGESVPDIERSRKIADVFGVSLDELVSYEPINNAASTPPPRGKHAFGIVKVGDKGQIVIPAAARRVFKIEAGDSLIVLGDEASGLALIKEKDFMQMIAMLQRGGEQ